MNPRWPFPFLVATALLAGCAGAPAPPSALVTPTILPLPAGAVVSLCADGRAAVEGPTDARAGQEFSILAFDLHGNATPFRLLVQDEAGRPVMDTPQDEIEGASPDAPARWFRVPAIPRGTYVLAWKGGEARFDPFGPATSC